MHVQHENAGLITYPNFIISLSPVRNYQNDEIYKIFIADLFDLIFSYEIYWRICFEHIN